MFLNPFTEKLVTFLTCGIAFKISNYSADKSTMSRDFPFDCAEAGIPLYVSLPLSVSSVPNAAATVSFPRALARIHWARPTKSY